MWWSGVKVRNIIQVDNPHAALKRLGIAVKSSSVILKKVLVRKWGDCLKQAKSTVTHYPSPHRSYAVCLWCLLVKACCITALPYLQYAYKQS